MTKPPLRFLHSDDSLVELKLDHFRRISTEDLIDSLKPEKEGALKTSKDGTIMDGHHRIKVLQERGVETDDLPREIWERVK